jgi:AcrR family transcriptional regulator
MIDLNTSGRLLSDSPQIRSPSTKSETIRRLLQVARAEFASKGLPSTRVDDIARAAGVTRQLVYHYFECKDELFGSVLEELSNGVMAELLAQTYDHLPPADALRALLDGVFDQYRENPVLGALSREITYHGHCFTPRNRFHELVPSLTQKVAAILSRGAAQGDFRPGVDPQHFMATVTLMTMGAFTTGSALSTILGYDPTLPGSMPTWQAASVEFLLAGVLACPPAAGAP